MDLLPFHPVGDGTMADASATSAAVAQRIGIKALLPALLVDLPAELKHVVPLSKGANSANSTSDYNIIHSRFPTFLKALLRLYQGSVQALLHS